VGGGDSSVVLEHNRVWSLFENCFSTEEHILEIVISWGVSGILGLFYQGRSPYIREHTGEDSKVKLSTILLETLLRVQYLGNRCSSRSF
jgi:hypothetical protein